MPRPLEVPLLAGAGMRCTSPGDRRAPVQRVVPGRLAGLPSGARVAIVDSWGSSYQALESDEREQFGIITSEATSRQTESGRLS